MFSIKYIDPSTTGAVKHLKKQFRMEVYPVFVAKSKIHDVATEMVRFVELRGQTGAEAEAEFKRFCDVTNLKNAHMKIEGEFMRDGVRLQLQSPLPSQSKLTYRRLG